MPKPTLTKTTFGKGSAAKQDARRKAHTAVGANKLAALVARQEGTTTEAQMTRASCVQYLQAHGAYTGHSRDTIDQLRDAVAAHKAAGSAPLPSAPAMLAAVPDPQEEPTMTTPTPRKATAPALPADTTEATCSGACGATLQVVKFPTIGGGKRASECRACRDTRLGRTRTPVATAT